MDSIRMKLIGSIDHYIGSIKLIPINTKPYVYYIKHLDKSKFINSEEYKETMLSGPSIREFNSYICEEKAELYRKELKF